MKRNDNSSFKCNMKRIPRKQVNLAFQRIGEFEGWRHNSDDWNGPLPKPTESNLTWEYCSETEESSQQEVKNDKSRNTSNNDESLIPERNTNCLHNSLVPGTNEKFTQNSLVLEPENFPHHSLVLETTAQRREYEIQENFEPTTCNNIKPNARTHGHQTAKKDINTIQKEQTSNKPNLMNKDQSQFGKHQKHEHSSKSKIIKLSNKPPHHGARKTARDILNNHRQVKTPPRKFTCQNKESRHSTRRLHNPALKDNRAINESTPGAPQETTPILNQSMKKHHKRDRKQKVNNRYGHQQKKDYHKRIKQQPDVPKVDNNQVAYQEQEVINANEQSDEEETDTSFNDQPSSSTESYPDVASLVQSNSFADNANDLFSSGELSSLSTYDTELRVKSVSSNTDIDHEHLNKDSSEVMADILYVTHDDYHGEDSPLLYYQRNADIGDNEVDTTSENGEIPDEHSFPEQSNETEETLDESIIQRLESSHEDPELNNILQPDPPPERIFHVSQTNGNRIEDFVVENVTSSIDDNVELIEITVSRKPDGQESNTKDQAVQANYKDATNSPDFEIGHKHFLESPVYESSSSPSNEETDSVDNESDMSGIDEDLSEDPLSNEDKCKQRYKSAWMVKEMLDPNPDIPSRIPAPYGDWAQYVPPRTSRFPHPFNIYGWREYYFKHSSLNNCVEYQSKSLPTMTEHKTIVKQTPSEQDKQKKSKQRTFRVDKVGIKPMKMVQRKLPICKKHRPKERPPLWERMYGETPPEDLPKWRRKQILTLIASSQGLIGKKAKRAVEKALEEQELMD